MRQQGSPGDGEEEEEVTSRKVDRENGGERLDEGQ